MGQVTVEFFGIPRQRADRAELTVQAGSVRELLTALETECPGLGGLRREDGMLAPHYLLSVDGRRFLAGADDPLPDGARLVLLSADPGG